MSVGEEISVKKRIMFLRGEDFNFLTYNVVLLLHQLNCLSSENAFTDHRKLAYLVDFVSTPELSRMILRRKRLSIALAAKDRHDLSMTYANGTARVHLITRLICALEGRGVLGVAKHSKAPSLNVNVNATSIPSSFLSDPLYEVEQNNITRLRTYSRHIRTVTLHTLLKQLFEDNGVRVWHS